MKQNPTQITGTLKALLCGAFLTVPLGVFAQSTDEMHRRVAQLEQELAQAKADLADAEAGLDAAADTGPSKIVLGDFRIGGAIRANYTIGDYNNGAAPSRGGDGGNFALDTFRINIDYADDQGILGKVEYRWYNGYNMLHTGWVGYQIDDISQVQVGVNRVPFGPGAYGISSSWFFDQHYYVGLADDMDLGVKYSTTMGNMALDLAYYFGDEGQWRGDSKDSARYSYDPVIWDNNGGYTEEHTFNARAIWSLAQDSAAPTEAGVSLQYGQLDAESAPGGGNVEDGEHFAASGHVKTSIDALTLQAQLTYYHYDIENDNSWGSAELIPFGAFDFAWPVAAEAYIAAAGASYFIPTPDINWLDSVNVYAEYSSILKEESSHNDSDLFTIGAAWARGGWYIYSELAYSNGNYFVGNDVFTEFGSNPDDEWQARYNINFGYYF